MAFTKTVRVVLLPREQSWIVSRSGERRADIARHFVGLTNAFGKAEIPYDWPIKYMRRDRPEVKNRSTRGVSDAAAIVTTVDLVSATLALKSLTDRFQQDGLKIEMTWPAAVGWIMTWAMDTDAQPVSATTKLHQKLTKTVDAHGRGVIVFKLHEGDELYTAIERVAEVRGIPC